MGAIDSAWAWDIHFDAFLVGAKASVLVDKSPMPRAAV